MSRSFSLWRIFYGIKLGEDEIEEENENLNRFIVLIETLVKVQDLILLVSSLDQELAEFLWREDFLGSFYFSRQTCKVKQREVLRNPHDVVIQ